MKRPIAEIKKMDKIMPHPLIRLTENQKKELDYLIKNDKIIKRNAKRAGRSILDYLINTGHDHKVVNTYICTVKNTAHLCKDHGLKKNLQQDIGNNLKKSGFVYIMTNPSMPGLIKVGMTNRNPLLRAKDNDLNSTGIPTPFQTQYFAFFAEMAKAEKKAHRKLYDYHYGKEFFKIDVISAVQIIESINIPFTSVYLNQEVVE